MKAAFSRTDAGKLLELVERWVHPPDSAEPRRIQGVIVRVEGGTAEIKIIAATDVCEVSRRFHLGPGAFAWLCVSPYDTVQIHVVEIGDPPNVATVSACWTLDPPPGLARLTWIQPIAAAGDTLVPEGAIALQPNIPDAAAAQLVKLGATSLVVSTPLVVGVTIPVIGTRLRTVAINQLVAWTLEGL